MVRLVTLLMLVPCVAALDVTPIGKVVQLLEGLKAETIKDAKNEATLYATFAKACKTQTGLKSAIIKKEGAAIGLESADLSSDATSKDSTSVELVGDKVRENGDQIELQNNVDRCRAEKADYNEADAKLSSSIAGLKRAFDAITKSMPSLIQTPHSFTFTQELKDIVDTGVAMGMVVLPEHKAVASFIQRGQGEGDVKDRTYGFRSDDINALFKSLHAQFVDQKKVADDKHAVAQKGCASMEKALKGSLAIDKEEIKDDGKQISRLESSIGDHRKNLVDEKRGLSEAELYLKDLTAECEARAKDWDQRTKMASDEVAAISSALAVLTGEKGVKQAADAMNTRAEVSKKSDDDDLDLITKTKPKVVKAEAPKPAAAAKAAEKAEVKAARKKEEEEFDEDELDAEAAVLKPISFMQRIKATSFLASTSATDAVRKEKALELLSHEGQRLKSLTLINLAQSSSADPFAKVKDLLEKLTDRLKAEAANESSKQLFCDGELAKAKKERGYRFSDTQELNADIAGLEAKKDSLTEAISAAEESLDENRKDLKEATKLRGEEKVANAKTLAKAHEGVEALKQATDTLQTFYSTAAKASLLQKASPIDEDVNAGFSGSSNGHQEGTAAIMGLLATIGSDFDRSIRTTEASEAKAARDFVKASQNFNAEIASSEMKLKLNQQDLKTTKTDIESKMGDLTTASSLLDEALKTLETLQPTCIDTGMTYKERTEKRDQEVEALKNAMKILGGE